MTEYSVHNEPDFARVYDDDEPITIRRGDLQALLDLATGSMDFGSGFWDNEQAEIAQNIARLLGIDPKLVTPANFVCRYFGHTWRWRSSSFYERGLSWKDPTRWVTTYDCQFCNKRSDSTPEIVTGPSEKPPDIAAPLPPPDRWEGLTQPTEENA